MGGIGCFAGRVGEWNGLGGGIVNAVPFFHSRSCSLLGAAVGSETAPLQGVWGMHGGWKVCRGCSAGSGDVSCRF